MNENQDQNLRALQEFLNYRFQDPALLARALTTPEYGNEKHVPHYETLETLGDAVAKLCLCLRLYEDGMNFPKKITQAKQVLESNDIYFLIAKTNELWKYVIYHNIPNIKEAKILADVFEAVIGAIFLDSNKNLEVVNRVIIDRFFQDWKEYLQNSRAFNKNELLEFLQANYKLTPYVHLDWEHFGPDHNSTWQATHPKILNKRGGTEILELPQDLSSEICPTQKDAENEIYSKILNHLKLRNNF